MFSFGKKSMEQYKTLHPKLQAICDEAIKQFDFTILCGHRGEKEQNEAFANNRSKLKFPKSKHNKKPSLAMDLAPYPIDWNDMDRFKALATLIKAIADRKGIDLRWGGDWKTFKDAPHYELTDEEAAE